MAKTTYKLLDFNYADASSGALCVMIKKRVTTDQQGNDTQDHEEEEDITYNESVDQEGKLVKNPDFKGAGVCRVSGGVCLFTVDSITYQFNKEGNPASSNAFGWVLKKAEILSTVTAQGSVATGNVKTVTKITRGDSGTTEEVQYVDEDNQMMVDKLTPRDEFAVHAMRAIMGHIADPSILSNNEVNHYCDAAYQWAANMMQAAANARDHKEYSSDDSGENVIDVLDTNTEKLLDNIDKALRKTDAEVGESSTSVPAHWSKEGYEDREGDYTDEAAASLPIPEGGQQYTSVAEAEADGWTWTDTAVVITPLYAERVTNDTYEKFMEYVPTEPGDTKTHYSFGDLLKAIREGGGGGGSAVSITPVTFPVGTTTVKIADFTINTTQGELRAPSGGGTPPTNMVTTDTQQDIVAAKDFVNVSVRFGVTEETEGEEAVDFPVKIDYSGISFNEDSRIYDTYINIGTVADPVNKECIRINGYEGVDLSVGQDPQSAMLITEDHMVTIKSTTEGGLETPGGIIIDGVSQRSVILTDGTTKPLSEIGGGITLNEPVSSINSINAAPSTDNQMLVYSNNQWGYANVPSGGGGITEAEMWTALGTNTTDQIIDSSHLPTPTLPSNLVTTDTSQVISGSKTFTDSGVRITYDTQTILPISSISETRKNIGTTEQPEYEYSLTVNGGSNLNLSVNSTNVLTSKSTGIETIKVQGGDEMPFKKECITYDSLRELLDKLEPLVNRHIVPIYNTADKKYKYDFIQNYNMQDEGLFYIEGTVTLAGSVVGNVSYPEVDIVNPVIELVLNTVPEIPEVEMYAVTYDKEGDDKDNCFITYQENGQETGFLVSNIKNITSYRQALVEEAKNNLTAYGKTVSGYTSNTESYEDLSGLSIDGFIMQRG